MLKLCLAGLSYQGIPSEIWYKYQQTHVHFFKGRWRKLIFLLIIMCNKELKYNSLADWHVYIGQSGY